VGDSVRQLAALKLELVVLVVEMERETLGIT
jgi:hypothetical protein